MEDYDECEMQYEIIQSMNEIFLNHLREFMRDNSYNRECEKNVELLIDRLNKKYLEINSNKNLQNCLNKEHMKLFNEMNLIKTSLDRSCRMYDNNKKDKEQLKSKENQTKSEVFNNNSELKNKLEIIDNFYTKEEFQPQEHKDYNENFYNENQEISSDLMNLELNEGNLYFLQELIENNTKEHQNELSEIDLMHLNEVKLKIKQLIEMVRIENEKSTYTLSHIEENVDGVLKDMHKANQELKQAALYKNKVNNYKYPLIMGSLLTLVGTCVPGIGNIIGATIGSGLGIAMAKLEKKAINKIDPSSNKLSNK